MLQQMELVNGRLARNGDTAGNVFVYVNPDENERKHLAESLKLDEHTPLISSGTRQRGAPQTHRALRRPST